MPSTVDEAKMMPVPESDVINPGSIYLACLNVQRKTDAESYWIVVRTPKEWLPEGFFDTRPVQARVFPFWIIGKDQRVWLPRTSLFCLDESQRHIFTERQKKLDFCRLWHELTNLGNVGEVLKHFEREILESTAQYNERRERIDEQVARSRRSRSLSSCMEDYTGALQYGPAKIDRTAVACAEVRQSTGVGHDDKVATKRRRREAAPTNISSTQTQDKGPYPKDSHTPGASSHEKTLQQRVTNLSASPSPPKSTVKTKVAVEIKVEAGEQIIDLTDDIMNNLRIRVYVGQSNVELLTDESVLRLCSPVLASYIMVNDDGSKYIMHPKLREIKSDDFMAVLQFMHHGDYKPVIVDIKNENIVETGPPPKGLQGLETAEDYSQALVRSGRIFLIAKTFQVRGMAEFIANKVKVTQFKEYSNKALIRFGRLLFTRKQPAIMEGFYFEAIDHWAVAQLANSFMSIMQSNIDRQDYMEMVGATAIARIHACVLERAANNYRTLGYVPMYMSDSD